MFEKFDPSKYEKIGAMPKRQQKKFKDVDGGGFVKKTAIDNPNEAIFIQDYSTKIKNSPFSEMIDDKSMEEAEKIIEQLKESKFDFSKIQWENLHLDDLSGIDNPRKRAEMAYERIARFDDPRLAEICKEFKKENSVTTKVVLVLFLCAMVGFGVNVLYSIKVSNLQKKLNEFSSQKSPNYKNSEPRIDIDGYKIIKGDSRDLSEKDV